MRPDQQPSISEAALAAEVEGRFKRLKDQRDKALDELVGMEGVAQALIAQGREKDAEIERLQARVGELEAKRQKRQRKPAAAPVEE